MALKQKFAWSTDAVIHYLELQFLRTLRHLGEPRALRFARLVAPLFTLPMNHRRHRNWEVFFRTRGWLEADRQKFEGDYFNYLARMYAEQACLAAGPCEKFRERITLNGVHHVKEALRAGRGALLVSGHLGNYRFIPVVLGHEGFNVTVVMRRLPLAANERYFVEMGSRYNVRIVFTSQNMVATFREVWRDNGIIYLAIDTPPADDASVCLPFGGCSLQLSRKPAVLACRYRVPVLYGAAPQEANGRTTVNLKPVEPLATAEELSAAWLRHLHTDVRRFPAQWWEWPFQTIHSDEFSRSPAMNVEMAG